MYISGVVTQQTFNKRLAIHCIIMAAHCKRLKGRLIIIAAEVGGDIRTFFPPEMLHVTGYPNGCPLMFLSLQF